MKIGEYLGNTVEKFSNHLIEAKFCYLLSWKKAPPRSTRHHRGPGPQWVTWFGRSALFESWWAINSTCCLTLRVVYLALLDRHGEGNFFPGLFLLDHLGLGGRGDSLRALLIYDHHACGGRGGNLSFFLFLHVLGKLCQMDSLRRTYKIKTDINIGTR